MEQKLTHDNTSALKVVAVMCVTWILGALFLFAWIWAIEKVQASNNPPAPVYEPQVTTQDYYQVAALRLTSDITGEAVISMDSFIVPVKFTYDSNVQRDETVIDIRSLEIGVITDITGQHKYRDFTNADDHRGINAAIIAYIKHKMGGVL